jgi:hypothetical protein
LTAIVVDAVVFSSYRIRTDLVVIAWFVGFAVGVACGETLYMRRSTTEAEG